MKDRLALPIAMLLSSTILAAPPTFSTKRLVNTPINGLLPFDVKTEDIDRDGDLDVYTANYSGRIAWYENAGGNPPGPWLEHVLTDFADGAEAAVAIRVDGDADVDFLSAAFNLEEIAWYSNESDAVTWTKEPITFECRLCTDVTSADLDGDGDNDAISASGFDGKIAWYENTGSFNPSWVPRVVSPAAAECVEAADLDQDGDLDVVAGLSWLESDGASPPAFKEHLLVAPPAYVANAIAILDVDRDGDLDVLSASQESDRVDWYENSGGLPPRWTPRAVSTTTDFATGVYAADLDGDADMDVLSASFFDNTIAWYENDGGSPPAWTKRAISTTAMGARSVFAADLEGDGDIDVLSASQSDARVVWHVNESDYSDADGDGMRDELDCASGDGTAFLVPREVSGARFRSRTELDWNGAVAGSGSGALYDVVRGRLSQPGTAETCLANGVAPRTLIDDTNPDPGTGFYYLIRASNACGTGSLGGRSSGVPRPSGACT